MDATRSSIRKKVSARTPRTPPAPAPSAPATLGGALPSDEEVRQTSKQQAIGRPPREGSKAWLQAELKAQTARAESLASREAHLLTSAVLGGHGAKAVDMLLVIPERRYSDILKIHNDLHGSKDTIRLSPEEHVMVGSTFTTLLEASSPEWLDRWGPALMISTTLLAVGVGKILLLGSLARLQIEIEEQKKKDRQMGLNDGNS